MERTIDNSTEVQGLRMRNLYLQEKQLKKSRKTIMLTEIPKPVVIKFKFIKSNTKKIQSKNVEVVPATNPLYIDKINEIIAYVENAFIEPILKDTMLLFKGQVDEVLKGGCKKDGKEYRALVRFSYKLSMNLGDIYNIKGEFHETGDEKLRITLENLNKLYYKDIEKEVEENSSEIVPDEDDDEDDLEDEGNVSQDEGNVSEGEDDMFGEY